MINALIKSINVWCTNILSVKMIKHKIDIYLN